MTSSSDPGTPGAGAPEAPLTFRGGAAAAFLPVAVFLVGCVLWFAVYQVFDMLALATGAVVGLLVGALPCRDSGRFWQAAMRGVSSPVSVTIIMILLVIGMYSQLVKDSGLSDGFVWLAESTGVSGSGFTAFVFVATCVVAMSTGSSIGTMSTALPIFFPAAAALGASPAMVAGAVVGGAIFGDNLAPISDTTIISSSTQAFRTRTGTADIGGVVRSRSRYALAAAAISLVAYLLLGGGGDAAAAAALGTDAGPRGLVMLLPVVAMLVVAVKRRDIFLAVTVGLVLGTVVALLAGLITPAGVVSVSDGAAAGFLVTGLSGMIGTVGLVIGVFGIMGVLTASGVLDRIAAALVASRLGSTPRGAEIVIGLGATIFTVLFGGVNSAAMVTVGPVADEVGSRVGLHPYRRANVMDCFAMGVGCVVPFVSAFLFIGATLTEAAGDAIPTTTLMGTAVYPLALTAVLVFSVATGWGRSFEGPDGDPVRVRPSLDAATDARQDAVTT